MDVELSRHLLSHQKHATVSPEALELMGKEAANKYLREGVSLNTAIAKMASAHPDFNAEQVKRVVEFANTAVYLAMHDKNKVAGAGSSYPQFELADAGRIIQDLSDGAKPTVTTQTDLDYDSLPTRKDKTSSAQTDEFFAELFKGASAEEEGSKDSALNDLMTTKHSLVGLRDTLRNSGEQFDLLHKSASADYYHHVKQHLLDGGSFADVIVAARSIGIDQEKLASALKPVITQLLAEKIAGANRLYEGAKGISKVAHRVVNDKHPLVSAFSAVILAESEIEKVAVALADVGQQLSRVELFIKEEFL